MMALLKALWKLRPPGEPEASGARLVRRWREKRLLARLERDRPFAEIGSDVDRDRTGLQKRQRGRVSARRMEQGMPAACVERTRYVDQIARTV